MPLNDIDRENFDFLKIEMDSIGNIRVQSETKIADEYLMFRNSKHLPWFTFDEFAKLAPLLPKPEPNNYHKHAGNKPWQKRTARQVDEERERLLAHKKELIKKAKMLREQRRLMDFEKQARKRAEENPDIGTW